MRWADLPALVKVLREKRDDLNGLFLYMEITFTLPQRTNVGGVVGELGMAALMLEELHKSLYREGARRDRSGEE